MLQVTSNDMIKRRDAAESAKGYARSNANHRR